MHVEKAPSAPVKGTGQPDARTKITLDELAERLDRIQAHPDLPPAARTRIAHWTNNHHANLRNAEDKPDQLNKLIKSLQDAGLWSLGDTNPQPADDRAAEAVKTASTGIPAEVEPKATSQPTAENAAAVDSEGLGGEDAGIPLPISMTTNFRDPSAAKLRTPKQIVEGLRKMALPLAVKTDGPLIHFADFPDGAPKRDLESCHGASAIVFDFDGRNGDTVGRADAEAACTLNNIEFISWNTFSSEPGIDTTFRLVLPVSSLIPIDEYKARNADAAKVLGITPPLKPLPASQGFFFSPREGGEPITFNYGSGDRVDTLWGAFGGVKERFEAPKATADTGASDAFGKLPLTERQIAEVRAVIPQMRERGLHLADGRAIAHQVVGALAPYGEIGKQLANEFAAGVAGSEKWVSTTIRAKLHKGATGIGRLFEIAAENGIENPATHKHTSAADDFAAELGGAEEEWATPVGLEAIEYTLDGFLSAGVTYIAGGHGIGKSSLLVPLASIVSGELPAFEQSISAMLQRKVIYITEDPSQAHRIRYGLKKHNGLVEKGNFRIAAAKRRSAGEIELMMEATVKAHTIIGPNGYPVKPLIVFDTTNACFEIENENDAAEVGRVMSALKQSGAPVWIIGHLPKAVARDDIATMTGRGSGAWEADAQGTAFIFAEDEATDVRYLATKKRRFEASYIEVKYVTHIDHEVVVSPWGEEQRIGFRYGIPERAHPGQRREEAANRKLEADIATILRYLGNQPGPVSSKSVEEGLRGEVAEKRVRTALRAGIERLILGNDGDYETGNNCVRHDGYYVRTTSF